MHTRGLVPRFALCLIAILLVASPWLSATAQESGTAPGGDVGTMEQCDIERRAVEAERADAKARWDEKRKAFASSQARAQEKWNAENPNATPEAREKFRHHQAGEREAFEAGVRSDVAAHESAWRERIARACAQPARTQPAPPASDECTRMRAEMDNRHQEFRADWDERVRKFETDYDAAKREFMARNPTEAEQRDFVAKWNTRREALQKEMHGAIAAHHDKTESEFRARCASATPAHGTSPAPAPPAYTQECRGLQERLRVEYDSREGEWRKRIDAFEREYAEAKAQLHASKPSEEQVQKFIAEWSPRREALHQQMRDELQKVRDDLFSRYQEKCGAFGGNPGASPQPVDEKCRASNDELRARYDQLRAGFDQRRQALERDYAAEKQRLTSQSTQGNAEEMAARAAVDRERDEANAQAHKAYVARHAALAEEERAKHDEINKRPAGYSDPAATQAEHDRVTAEYQAKYQAEMARLEGEYARITAEAEAKHAAISAKYAKAHDEAHALVERFENRRRALDEEERQAYARLDAEFKPRIDAACAGHPPAHAQPYHAMSEECRAWGERQHKGALEIESRQRRERDQFNAEVEAAVRAQTQAASSGSGPGSSDEAARHARVDQEAKASRDLAYKDYLARYQAIVDAERKRHDEASAAGAAQAEHDKITADFSVRYKEENARLEKAYARIDADAHAKHKAIAEEFAAKREQTHREREAGQAQVKAKFEARSREMDERHRREWDAFKAASTPPEACRAPPATATPAPMPARAEPGQLAAAPCNDEQQRVERLKFEEIVREEGVRFEREAAAKRAYFQQEIDRLVAEWNAGTHTEAETSAFTQKLNERRVQFELQIEERAGKFRLQLEERWREFAQRQAQRCYGPAQGPAFGSPTEPARAPHPVEPGRPVPRHGDRARDLHATVEAQSNLRDQFFVDLELERNAFRARQAAELEAFLTKGPSDSEKVLFVRLQAQELENFELKLKLRIADFEKHRRSEWDEARAKHAPQSGADFMGSFTMAGDPSTDATVRVAGQYVAFTGVPACECLTDYAVRGAVVFTRVSTEAAISDFRFQDSSEGSALVLTGDSVKMRFHDNPAGVVNLASSASAAITLVVAPHLTVQVDDSGTRFSLVADGGDGGVRGVLVVREGGAAWDAASRTLVIRGGATFLIKDEKPEVLTKVREANRPNILDAVVEKRVAAEVNLVAAAPGTGTTGAAQAVRSEVVAYGDVNVKVAAGANAGATKGRVVVNVDSAQPGGKTLVFNLDRQVLGSAGVKVDYFEVEGGQKVAKAIKKASNLEDVLNAQDDGNDAEYLIVVTDEGTQAIVSIPHFSEKELVFEPAAADPDASASSSPDATPAPAPSALLPGPGAVAVFAMAGAVAVALRGRFARRP